MRNERIGSLGGVIQQAQKAAKGFPRMLQASRLDPFPPGESAL